MSGKQNFPPVANTAIVAIIWKPGLRDRNTYTTLTDDLSFDRKCDPSQSWVLRKWNSSHNKCVDPNRFSKQQQQLREQSAISDQSQFFLHTRRSNARVFEWISRKRVGKYGGKCIKERMESFQVWKTKQASKGSLATCCWIKKWCFLESGFGKSLVFQALSIVYSYVEPTNKSRKKKKRMLLQAIARVQRPFL